MLFELNKDKMDGKVDNARGTSRQDETDSTTQREGRDFKV